MDHVVLLINRYAHVPVLLTTVVALILYKKLPQELRVLCHFIFLSGVVELISKILWFQSINNMPLLHLYVATGFACIARFYKQVLGDFMSGKIILGMIAFVCLFTVTNIIFLQGLFAFASFSLMIESILIIILSMSTFLLLMNQIMREQKTSVMKSLNWINAGFFIYYTSSMLIFYFGDFFTRKFPVAVNQYTWVFHTLFLTIMYGCFIVGLLLSPKRIEPLSSMP